MHKGNMDVKVRFIIAIICIAISKLYLHNCGLADNDKQEVNGTNALIYFRGGAVKLFNMNIKADNDIGFKTEFSDKLQHLIKTSSEQFGQGQSNVEYENAINNSSDIVNEIKANIELNTKMRYDDIVAKQETEKNLNEIIGLMEYKEVKQASNYLKNKRRVIIDQSSKNKELFNELLATSVASR